VGDRVPVGIGVFVTVEDAVGARVNVAVATLAVELAKKSAFGVVVRT